MFTIKKGSRKMLVELLVNWEDGILGTSKEVFENLKKEYLNNPITHCYDFEEYFDSLTGDEIFSMLTEENKIKVVERLSQDKIDFEFEQVEIEV